MIFQCRGINHYTVSSRTDQIICTIKLSKLTNYFFSSLLNFTKDHSCADILDILITKPRAQCVLFPLSSQSFQQFTTGIVVFYQGLRAITAKLKVCIQTKYYFLWRSILLPFAQIESRNVRVRFLKFHYYFLDHQYPLVTQYKKFLSKYTTSIKQLISSNCWKSNNILKLDKCEYYS